MSVDKHQRSVFISYATSDRERALEICQHLEALGHKCWIAPRDIRSGHDYGEEIIRGIEHSRCFVLVLSAAANSSIYVKREVERAVAKAKPVFPVRVEDVPPSPALELHLASLHYLDAWSGALEDHMARLARDLADSPQAQSPVTRPVSRPVWWRWRLHMAAGVAVLAVLGLFVWQSGNAPSPDLQTPTQTQTQAQTPTVPPGAVSFPPDPATWAIPGVKMLEHCAPTNEGPIYRCPIREPNTLLVSSPQGGKVVIEGGSASSASIRQHLGALGTFLPWLGPGTAVQIKAADGSLSEAVALPTIDGMAAAIPVPSADKNAPTLVYALRPMQRKEYEWAYLFFAPFDTQDVEWSKDELGFIRAEHLGGMRERGPLWIESDGSGDEKISIRWRHAGAEWSGPVTYRFDAGAARQRGTRSLVDLADNIKCYRKHLIALTYVQCATLSVVALGELLDQLHWGTSPTQLVNADDFDFKQWAATFATASTPPAPPSNCRDNACQSKVNDHARDARVLQGMLAFNGAFFAPWREVSGSNAQDKSNFLAIAEPVDDVFFSAVPRGGGAPLTARIKVSDRELR